MTEMRRGWFHLARGAGVGRIFGFASNLLLSRLLGPTDLGLFNLVTTTIQTTDTLVRCGADYALNFELGGHAPDTEGDRGVLLAQGLAQICSLMSLFICFVIALWVWWGHGLFPSSFQGSQRLTLSALLLFMVVCEGSSASAWEVLLVYHRTAQLSLRLGLFLPLRLLFATTGALFGGVMGAMCGWSFISAVQCFWLRRALGHLWNPFKIWPLLCEHIRLLLRRGLPFYASNLLASLIFFPLLLKVAASSGLAEVGYLRAGQILQQIFAFIPATLVPILFLKLRAQSSFEDQVLYMEKPLRVVWLFSLEILLLYCMFDKALIDLIFGSSFILALLPTRLLLITALFECLTQIVVQPVLAAGQTRLYVFWQNTAAILSVCLGWIWIPAAGLAAYLALRVIYVIVPLIGFAVPVAKKLKEPYKMLSLALVSIGMLVIVMLQTLTGYEFTWLSPAMGILFIAILIVRRQDFHFLRQVISISN